MTSSTRPATPGQCALLLGGLVACAGGLGVASGLLAGRHNVEGSSNGDERTGRRGRDDMTGVGQGYVLC